MIQKIPIDSVIVDGRTRKTMSNVQRLADNISEIGLLSPIVVNKSNRLIAGERRLEACKLLGWKEIDAIVKDTKTAEQELEMEISENVHREDFTREEIISAGISIERIEKIKATERKEAGQFGSTVGENFPVPSDDVGRARDIVGKKLGMSGKQYERDKSIVAHKDLLPPGMYDDWNTRAISTNKIYTLLTECLAEKEQIAKKEVPQKNQPSPQQSKPPKNDAVYDELKAQLKMRDLQIDTLRNNLATARSIPAVSNDENLRDEIEELRATIAEKDKYIKQLETDTDTIHDAAFLERSNTEIYRNCDGTGELYELAREVKTLLETKLAPLKFRRCFERVPQSSTARDNVRELLNKVQSWCDEIAPLITPAEDAIDEVINIY